MYICYIKVYKIKIYVTETFIFLLTLKFYFIGYYDCKGFNYRHLKSPTSSFIGTCSKLRYIYIHIYIYLLFTTILLFILLTWSEEVLSTETAVTATE